jgi:hypothetical protein
MAGAEPAAGFFCWDSSADDTVGVAAAISVLPVEGDKRVARGDDDELVPSRQHIGLTDAWEANLIIEHVV